MRNPSHDPPTAAIVPANMFQVQPSQEFAQPSQIRVKSNPQVYVVLAKWSSYQVKSSHSKHEYTTTRSQQSSLNHTMRFQTRSILTTV